MKVVILAGGRGERMKDETTYRPKPLIEIGNKPILWHIMKIYSFFGFNSFIMCLGYQGNMIKDYFLNYSALNYDCRVGTSSPWVELLQENYESEWDITLVDTGIRTQTGGRIKRIQRYVENSTFMCTYGDGVANIDIPSLIEVHKANVLNGCLATLTTVPGRSKFGDVEWGGGKVTSFEEKSKVGWVNGGFFVFEPAIFYYLGGDTEPLEAGLLTKLTKMNALGVYTHDKFWGCMDDAKEMEALNKLAESDAPPWRVW